MMTEIPPILIEHIKNKNIVLFLGSGFAFNAKHPTGKNPPLGNELANMIADKFLGGSFKNDSLTFISDLAISESNLFDVQKFIFDIFEPFSPNESHLIYPKLPWKAIFTTNYDRILEKAYDNNNDNLQKLSIVFRNTPEQQIFKGDDSVPYYKLHGCISYINDKNLPLVLSTEQYITHKKNRDRLFRKLEDLSRDYPFIFIGYSNQDHNIRTILKQLESLGDGRPRSYMISPNISQQEISYWEKRSITPISIGHEEFIKTVSDKISVTERKLSAIRKDEERKIYNKFTVNTKELVPTNSLLNFLDFETEFINNTLQLENTSPQSFYKGYFNNWDPIIRNLDIRRNIENRILTDLILEDTFQEESNSFLFIIKGFGGSVKSVLLKRLAWESAVVFDKLCLYFKPGSVLRAEPILELYNYVKERIYLFIDNALENEAGIIDCIKKMQRDGVPLTIISTERINQLNEEKPIQNFITQEYKLTYLKDNEIDLLLEKLELHNSLGYLENKTIEERKNELGEKAGRVLLVALYEATGGKPFEEIIIDEYNSIIDEDAQSLYLTVSVFHRLNTKARAGLISRIHNIGFHQFKERLFKPLEYIVFSERDNFIGDYIYSTRHTFIAQIIFELVLKNEQDRYDEYIRIIQNLDIDYQSDWFAFLDITNARKLKEIFNDPIRIRNIYDLAETISPDDPKLIQQRGIYEMISNAGSIFTAQKLLKRANSLAPDDLIISHSLAEVSIKKAELSNSAPEKNQYLTEAESLCRKIIKKQKDHSYSYHSLLKIALIRFTDTIEKNSSSGIENQMKNFEKILNEAKQSFPDQEFILEIEARFNEIMDNEPKAVSLLEEAYKLNKASPYLAIRFSKILDKQGLLEGAIKVLKETNDLNPNDRDVNYLLATLLSKNDPTNYEDIIHFYRRSFTMGDTRYESQFWYARALYLNGLIDKAKPIFKDLTSARVPPHVKNRAKGIVLTKSGIESFKGTIINHESSFAFIRREKHGDDIFVFKDSKIKNWEEYRIGINVTFNVAFNYKGIIAINTEIIKSKL